MAEASTDAGSTSRPTMGVKLVRSHRESWETRRRLNARGKFMLAELATRCVKVASDRYAALIAAFAMVN
jgi:hypothetical protein